MAGEAPLEALKLLCFLLQWPRGYAFQSSRESFSSARAFPRRPPMLRFLYGVRILETLSPRWWRGECEGGWGLELMKNLTGPVLLGPNFGVISVCGRWPGSGCRFHVYQLTRVCLLIPDSNARLPRRRVTLSSLVLQLEFPGSKLSESHPASYVTLPKAIGLGLSGVRAGRQRPARESHFLGSPG